MTTKNPINWTGRFWIYYWKSILSVSIPAPGWQGITMGIRTWACMQYKRCGLDHVVFDVVFRIHFLNANPVCGITLQTYERFPYLIQLFFKYFEFSDWIVRFVEWTVISDFHHNMHHSFSKSFVIGCGPILLFVRFPQIYKVVMICLRLPFTSNVPLNFTRLKSQRYSLTSIFRTFWKALMRIRRNFPHIPWSATQFAALSAIRKFKTW